MTSWIETPYAYALSWTLVHFVWQGALVALSLAAIFQILRPRSARVRYGLACVALLAMPAIFGLNLASRWPVEQPMGTIVLPAEGMAGPEAPAEASAHVSATPEMAIWKGLPWLAPLWMFGVSLFTFYRLTGWMAAQRLRRMAVCAAPPVWRDRLNRLAGRLRLPGNVALLESSRIDQPVMMGYFRPVILLPVGLLAGLPVEQVEYILIHELAHVLRRDYVVNLLQSVVEGLLFYHPAVWWVSGMVRAERENCCDDIVVEQTGDSGGYASVLSRLEHGRALPAAVAVTGGSLPRRIRRLLGLPGAPHVAGAPAMVTIGLLVVWGGVAIATGRPGSAAPTRPQLSAPVPAPIQRTATPEEAAAVASPRAAKKAVALLAQARPALPAALMPPYEKWMREDVAYIITDEERQTFTALQTNEEREQFIEQFWRQRDPTPGTVENEFKEEHYRRIAYSNKRYGWGDVPGWKTDRGTFYIVFGPPDQIETHPNPTDTAPYENWLYRHVEGAGDNLIFNFTDPNRTGEFPVTQRPGGLRGPSEGARHTIQAAAGAPQRRFLTGPQRENLAIVPNAVSRPARDFLKVDAPTFIKIRDPQHPNATQLVRVVIRMGEEDAFAGVLRACKPTMSFDLRRCFDQLVIGVPEMFGQSHGRRSRQGLAMLY